MATDHARRLFLLAVVFLASTIAVTILWASRAAASHTPAVQRWDGFAGPVETAPRPVEYVLGSGERGTLVHVPCAGGGSARCYVAQP